MSKREDYKRFIVFCLASVVILAQTAVFAYVWYDFYRKLIFEPFWRKGNWVLIAIYGLILMMFSKMYGGLKVGYLKKIDVFYSLTLATILYEHCDVSSDYPDQPVVLPAHAIIEMTFVQIVLIVVWIFGTSYAYSRIYRARKLLIIYGDRSPGI